MSRIVVAWLVVLSAATVVAAESKPNIIYVLCDDLGYGDVRCLNPAGKIATPNMDRLAAGGMTFTDAHTGSAVCTPTRYGVITGRYAWRTPLQKFVLGGLSPRLIEQNRMTVASMLRDAGYHTACIGKWHLGMDWVKLPGKDVSELTIEKPEQVWNVDYTKPIANGPTTVGFDYYYGIAASLDMVPYTYIENDHVTKVPTVDKRFAMMPGQEGKFTRTGPSTPEFEATDVLPQLTRKTVEYIDAHAADAKQGKPFFVYLPLASPHTPIAPSAEWLGKSGLNPYADFVMQTDACLGEVLEALERNGLTNDTLVVLTSDNGCSPSADYPALLAKGHNPSYVFRGTKADIFDGGHRVPFLVRWPAKVKAGTQSNQLLCLTDFMATAAEIVGAALPDNAAEDSISFLATLTGAQPKQPREAAVHHSINGSFAIRQGKWKLELCPGSGGWSAPRPGADDTSALPEVQLYDLESDIGEQQNLQDKHPDIVSQLTHLLETYVTNGRSTPGKPQANAVEVDMWNAGREAHQPLPAKKKRKAA
ncbi:MAG TPA: arylsulfatase [Pirellulales bacterium]|nr:arylsulfatase [Pirellulales bacterium]